MVTAPDLCDVVDEAAELDLLLYPVEIDERLGLLAVAAIGAEQSYFERPAAPFG